MKTAAPTVASAWRHLLRNKRATFSQTSSNTSRPGRPFIISAYSPDLEALGPLVRSAFCPKKIDHTSGLTLHPGYNLQV